MEENMQALMERLNSSSQFLQSNDMRVTEVRHGFAKVEMIIDESNFKYTWLCPWWSPFLFG